MKQVRCRVPCSPFLCLKFHWRPKTIEAGMSLARMVLRHFRFMSSMPFLEDKTPALSTMSQSANLWLLESNPSINHQSTRLNIAFPLADHYLLDERPNTGWGGEDDKFRKPDWGRGGGRELHGNFSFPSFQIINQQQWTLLSAASQINMKYSAFS